MKTGDIAKHVNIYELIKMYVNEYLNGINYCCEVVEPLRDFSPLTK